MKIDVKHRVLIVLCGGALALSSGLCGCERSEDSADAAIRTAAYELKALTDVRPRAKGPKTRTRTYEMVVRELQPVVSSGDKEQQVAASRMLSKAQAGLARIEAERAQELEFEALDLVREAKTLLQEYRRRMAYAESLVAADVGAGSEIEELQRQRDEKDAERARLRAARDEMAAELTEHEDEAQALFELAGEKRREAGSIRTTASDIEAERRVEVIEQAITIEREADALEIEAELILANVARRAPDLATLDRQLTLLDKESEGFERNASLLRDRDMAMREQSAASRQKAMDVTAEELHLVLVALSELRSGPLFEHYEKANDGFERAIGTYRSVMGASRGPDRSAAAQGLAGMQKSRAAAMATWMSGERRAVEALQAAVNVTPGLAERSSYENMLEARSQALSMSTNMVRDAFNGAGEALANAGEDELAMNVQALMAEVLQEEAPPADDADAASGQDT